MKKLEDMTEPELATLLQDMGDAIQIVAQKHQVEKPLFALVLFNDPAVGQYIANCYPQDVIHALRECADKLARNLDVPR